MRHRPPAPRRAVPAALLTAALAAVLLPLLLLAGLLAGVAASGVARAQEAPSPAGTAAEPVKYWVFFADRPAAAVPEAGRVTERARLRRSLRGAPSAERYDAPVSPEGLAALRRMGVAPLVESRWLNAASAMLTDAQVRTVAALPSVRGLKRVGVLEAARTHDTQVNQDAQVDEAASPVFVAPPLRRAATSGAEIDFGPSRRQLANINAVAPLERGINGTGVILGFLDTEYGEFQHVVFDRLRAEGRLLGYQNFAQAPQTNRHGQNVASIAVGYDEGDLVGPGWGAFVLAATTEYAPTETNVEEDNFVRGLEWLESQGVDVVNTSLGYTTFDTGQQSYTPDDLDGDRGVTTMAVDRAAAMGVVVVTSAGNEGDWNNTGIPCEGYDRPAGCWYFIGTPADADSVIAVGAVRFDSTRAAFSSYGPTVDGRIKPDVTAPGQSIVYATGTTQYATGSGTSFSSPLVAGVVAQMLQVNPTLGPIEVRDLLRATASHAAVPDTSYGWGIINADAAIQSAAERLVDTEDRPEALRVVRPYPNPSAGRVTFEVHTPAYGGTVRLSLYDLMGRRAATPVDYALHFGINRLVFDPYAPDRNDLAAGVYLYVLEGEGLRETGRIVLLR